MTTPNPYHELPRRVSKHTPLSLEERQRIEAYLAQGCMQKNIARALGRSDSVISHEIKHRRKGDKYNAQEAHQIYLEDRKLQYTQQYRQFTQGEKDLIRERLTAGHTPNSLRRLLKCGREALERFMKESSL